MKISKFFTALLPVLCLILSGCRNPAPVEVARVAATGTTVAQVSGEPTTSAATPTPPPLTTQIIPFNVLRGLPTPTSSRSSLYLDIWISGFMWYEHEGLPTIRADNSSLMGYIGRPTYEAANETVAEALAQYPLFTLVVLYGDYTPPDDQDGHIVVKRVEQVNLPYSEDTPLSESYTHPDYGFSFNYPEDWTIVVHSSTDLRLRNHPAYAEQFHGPLYAEIHDPTEISVGVSVSDISIEEFVETRWYTVERLSDLPLEITVTERTINGLPVIEVDQRPSGNSPFSPHRVSFFVPLNDGTFLIFYTTIEDVPFVERLIATLSLP